VSIRSLAHRSALLCVVALLCAEAAAQQLSPFKLDGHLYVPIAENKGPQYTIRLSLSPPKGEQALERFSVLFGADTRGDGYRLEARGRKWQLSSVSAGRRRVLAEGRTNLLPGPGPLRLRITRRLWLLTVAFNGTVVAEVQDYSHGPGLVAVDAATSAPAEEPVVQPLSELNFADGFMRTQDELDLTKWKLWRLAGGKWKVHSVQENVELVDVARLPQGRRPQAERSPNPFSLSGFADGSGVFWTGEWFWSDYRAGVSVRNRGAKAVGLAFNIAGPQDMFLVRWENATPVLQATPVELVRVRGGQRTVLGKTWVNGQLDQWFNIGVRTCGTRIQVLLDGAVIMDLTHPESIGGGVGLYVEGGDEEHQAFFDDVSVHTITRIDYTNADWIEKHARPSRGSWGSVKVEEPGWPPALAPVLRSRSGELMLGATCWPAPCLKARVSVPRGRGKVGFLVGGGGPAGRRWRVAMGRAGENLSLEISEESEQGAVRLAACQDVPLPPGGLAELCADFTREGEINVSVEGRLWLRAPRSAPAQGAPGIFAAGARGTEFRHLSVCFRREEDKERLPAEQVFKDDPYMKHWSSPQGESAVRPRRPRRLGRRRLRAATEAGHRRRRPQALAPDPVAPREGGRLDNC